MEQITYAIEVASKAHHNQFRKGTEIPYIAHPFAVGMYLTKAKRPKEEIIAGILHDTIEDTYITYDFIVENFGETIADIVKGCSEPDKSLSWKHRKEHTIEYLKTASEHVLWVACADKLHNLRTIISEYEKFGNDIWIHFAKGFNEQKWYYESLLESMLSHFGKNDVPELFKEFAEEIENFFGRKK